MNYWSKIFLLSTKLFFSFSLLAQKASLDDLQIKDTSALNKIVSHTLSEIKQTKKIDKNKIDALLKSALELKDTATFFKICNKTDEYYYRINGSDQEAILFLKECQRAIGTVDTRFGNVDNSIGNYYRRLKFFTEALDYYFKSIEWHKKYEIHNTTIPLGNVAEIYFKYQNYEKALEYNQLALSYSLKLKDPEDRLYNIIYDYYRIGAIYHELKEDTKAEIFYQKSLDAAAKYKHKNTKLSALVEAIKFYDKIGKNEYCEELIGQVYALFKDEEISDSYLGQIFLLEESKHYLNIGNLSKALNPKEIQFENPSLKSKVLFYSADYYTYKKDIEKAANFYEKLLEEKEKVERERMKNVLSNFEEKYLNKELRKTNIKLANDIEERKRNNFIILASLIFISSLLILQLYNNNRRKKLNKLLKNKTRELGILNTDLAKSNEELERFAYIASHDLKTPLRTIVSFTSLLEHELKSIKSESVHQYLLFIKKAGLRLNSLITSTLEYSRLSSSGKVDIEETIDLNFLLKEVEHSMSHYIVDRNAKIIIQHKLPTIKAYHSSLLLLFQNILENGMKYNKSETPIINISISENSTFLSVFIEDNGIGISEEYFDKTFIMYSRLHTHDEFEGSGLGLSICKKIVEQLNGEIHIQSEIEKGSIFEIKLPNNLIVVEGSSLEKMKS